MKRILVPVDFSKEAENAARVAVSIAKKTNSEIFLLHMLELPVNIIDPTEIASVNTGPQALFYMKQANEQFKNFVRKPFFKGVKVVESIQFQLAFSGIIEESKKNNIDLIVMGSQGASGLKEMFIGSNTEKVVRKSDIPVLVIKKRINDFDVKNMIFASDFRTEGKKSFPKVLEFAKIFKPKIHFLYVNTIHNFNTTKEIEKKMDQFINDFEIDNYEKIIYNDISVEKGILSYARDIDADLIALNTHGRSGLSQLFNGSIGRELANHALRPVITFKL
ncbi:MAG: universal stress protein [Flavobacteriia bacterium]|nr:MAG: universal stress protein [Flavobacteriia bacterium]